MSFGDDNFKCSVCGKDFYIAHGLTTEYAYKTKKVGKKERNYQCSYGCYCIELDRTPQRRSRW